ncbi:MAG: tetraacyldisaccharide 4'-kinase [Candidatus Kapaibacterium sp.]
MLSALYGRVVAYRNKRYDHHQLPIVPVDKPVISVGNITAGGSGKTPTTQLLVRLLRDAGRHPAIVMRGYKRRSRGLVVVHDGKGLVSSLADSGDEAYMHATMLDVPVVVSSDKVEAAAYAAGHLPCDVIIVDDGFQHRALHRDVDIVIVDQASMNGSLLPGGRLREPLTALNRADIILTSEGVSVADVEKYVKPTAHVFTLERRTNCSAPADRPVVAVSGIARPERFHASLRDRGYSIAESIVFGDHHRYSAFNVRRIVSAAQRHGAQILTTSKDAVKLRPLMLEAEVPMELNVLELEVHLHSSSSFLSAVLPRITP